MSHYVDTLIAEYITCFLQDGKLMRCIGTKVTYITKEQREFSIETANQSGKPYSY